MDEPVLSREFWRLGHRRPWWQWNVITLFVPLFLLVWIREFFRVPQVTTWLMCMAVLAVWFAAPLVLMSPLAQDADPARTRLVAPTSDGVRHGYLLAAVAMFGCVLLFGGVVAGAFSVLAAMLYGAAIRAER